MAEDKENGEELDFKKWLEILTPHDHWNERHLMLMFAYFGMPHTMLDVGSGTGAMVNLARKMGVNAWGVDQIPRVEDYLIQDNLAEPFALSKYDGPSVCDMVISIEVAEHLPPDKDVVICDTIASHVAKDGKLIFTSAHPGQGGDDHVGERPQQHWRELFWQRGLSYSNKDSAMISLLWSNIFSPLMWLPANVQVFFR